MIDPLEKLVSFSLYGNLMRYYHGAKENIKSIPSLLPGWKIRIYYHRELTLMNEIDELSKFDVHLEDVTSLVIGGNESKNFAMWWRYLPCLENKIVLVRDLDSRIYRREVDYINRWLLGDKPWFVIRDHPWQSLYPGGLIGTRPTESFKEHFLDKVSKTTGEYNTDQDMLYSFFKDIPKSNIEYCTFTDPSMFLPRTTSQEFIGLQIDENNNPNHNSLGAL